MKVAVISTSLTRANGGVSEVARRTIQEVLAWPEISGVALGLRDCYSEEDSRQWAPVPCRFLPLVGPAVIGFCSGLSSALSEESPNLIHAHGIWTFPQWYGMRWASRRKLPTLVTVHGMLDPWALANSRPRKVLASWVYQRRALCKASCLHVSTVQERDSVRAYGATGPICLIPNGVDLPQTTEGSGLQTDGALTRVRRAGRCVLLYLGRIHPKKGLINLLKGWASIRNSEASVHNSEPDRWVLAIAGWDQGGHEEELKRLCTELGNSWIDVRDGRTELPDFPTAEAPSILFLGPQFGGAKADCYRNCDAFILPSLSEGLPMVVLEAWAYAKPVLMTSECNLPEGVATGAAMLIKPEVASIAQGLQKLVSMPNCELQAMGNRGALLVAERFSWHKVAEQMHSVYSWLLGRSGKPECVFTD